MNRVEYGVNRIRIAIFILFSVSVLDHRMLGVDGLQLNEINLPKPENEGIENLVPIPRTLKRREQNPLSKTEDMDNSDWGLLIFLTIF